MMMSDQAAHAYPLYLHGDNCLYFYYLYKTSGSITRELCFDNFIKPIIHFTYQDKA